MISFRSSRRLLPVLLAAATFWLAAAAVRADFTWFNDVYNRAYYADGITPLFGVKGSNDVSCFVQLIYAGGDGLIDPASYNDTQGKSGDDQVVAWSYIAANLVGASGSTNHYGRLSGGNFTSEIPNGQYYVRVWTAPADNFLSGFVPTATSNFYGNSTLFTALAGYEPPSQPQNFNFGGVSGIIANMSPVPEPSTFLLMIAGLCTLRRWARREN